MMDKYITLHDNHGTGVACQAFVSSLAGLITSTSIVPNPLTRYPRPLNSLSHRCCVDGPTSSHRMPLPSTAERFRSVTDR